MPGTSAEGANFAIDRTGEHVRARFWRRPDLDSAEGARLASEFATSLRGALANARTLLLDLREAPAVTGPSTLETLGPLAQSCERRGIRIALVIGNDPLQRLQITRIARELAPQVARIFDDAVEAADWVA
jgi:hypothetical protein